MLVYRKQGYESKAFRVQLKQLAESFEGVLLEDRHAFTYVAHEYFRIGLYKYKEDHEQTDKFNKVAGSICDHYNVPATEFMALCKSDLPGFKYLLLMSCYFLKVSEAYVIAHAGQFLFPDISHPERHYQAVMDVFHHDYNSGKQSSEVIDRIVNSIKTGTHPFTVYNWSNDRYTSDRSFF